MSPARVPASSSPLMALRDQNHVVDGRAVSRSNSDDAGPNGTRYRLDPRPILLSSSRRPHDFPFGSLAGPAARRRLGVGVGIRSVLAAPASVIVSPLSATPRGPMTTSFKSMRRSTAQFRRPPSTSTATVLVVNTAIFSPSGRQYRHRLRLPLARSAPSSRSFAIADRDRVLIGVRSNRCGLDRRSLNLVHPGSWLPAATVSPAVTAGIRPGESSPIQRNPVRYSRELSRTIGSLPPNTILLRTVRTGAEPAITLTLGELPTAQAIATRNGGAEQGTEVPRLALTLSPAATSQAAHRRCRHHHCRAGQRRARHGFRTVT